MFPSLIVACIKSAVASISDGFMLYKIDRIHFMKMDIEGSEVQVLTLSREILMKFKPRLIVEPHYINGRLNDKEIMIEMKSIGYKCEVVAQGEFDHQPLLYFFCEE
jgi:hypothetical protein